MHETCGLCTGGYHQIEAKTDGFALPPTVERKDDHTSRNRVLGEEDLDAPYDASYAECNRDEEAEEGHSLREEGPVVEFGACDWFLLVLLEIGGPSCGVRII